MKRTCFSSLGEYARILAGAGSGMVNVFDEKNASSLQILRGSTWLAVILFPDDL